MIEFVRSRYADLGPTLATAVLLEKDGVKVSGETLRKWMVEDGLWLSRKQRRVFHQPRLRREFYGELIQIDGSEHRWFEDRVRRVRLLCSSTTRQAARSKSLMEVLGCGHCL